LVNEANLIAQEMKRDVKFSTKLVKTLPEHRGTSGESLTEMGKTEILIRVDNGEVGYYYMWDEDKFQNRLYMMRDLVNEYFETGELPDLKQEEDPYWDPPDPVLIGQCFLRLQNLLYLVENEQELKILSTEGKSGVRGLLMAKYFPMDSTGEGDPPEDDLPDEPDDMLGKPIDFRIELDWAKQLPADVCKNVFVEYGFYFEKGVKHRTPEFEGKTQNP